MGKKKEVALQVMISTEEEWENLLSQDVMYVVDAYLDWAGPCTAMVDFLKKLKHDFGDNLLHFACVKVDDIPSLAGFLGKSQPNFLIYGAGELIGQVRGCNAPLLLDTIRRCLHHEHEVREGMCNRDVIWPNYDYDEEELSDGDGGDGEGDEDDEEEDSLLETCKKEVTLAIIKPDLVMNGQADEIISKLEEYEIEVMDQLRDFISEECARELYFEHTEETYFTELIEYMTSGECVMLALTKVGDTGRGIVDLWREVLGPFDAAVAKETHAATLRAMYGIDAAINGLHGSSTIESALREVAFFFPDLDVPSFKQIDAVKHMSGRLRRTASGSQLERTLCIIRPPAWQEFGEEIVDKLEAENLVVGLRKEMKWNEDMCKMFFESIQETKEYAGIIKAMLSGKCLCLCLVHEFAIDTLNDLLGPIAMKDVRENPDCLRFIYQPQSTTVNSIHGSQNVMKAENELRAIFLMDQTIVVIKPEAYEHRDKIVKMIDATGIIVSYQQSMTLSKEIACDLYKKKEKESYFNDLIDHVTSGPSHVLLVSAMDSVKQMRKLIGHVNPMRDRRKDNFNTLRAQWGFDIFKNSIHTVSNEKKAREAIQLIFGEIDLDWDGYLKKPMKTPGAIRPLKDLVGEDDEEEEEEGEEDDDFDPIETEKQEKLADEAWIPRDSGPIALIPPPLTEEELLQRAAAEAAAIEAATIAAEEEAKKKKKGKKGKKGKKTEEPPTPPPEEEDPNAPPKKDWELLGLEDFGVRTINTWSHMKLVLSGQFDPNAPKGGAADGADAVGGDGSDINFGEDDEANDGGKAKGKGKGKDKGGKEKDKGGKAKDKGKDKGKDKVKDKSTKEKDKGAEATDSKVTFDGADGSQYSGIVECRTSKNPLTRKCQSVDECNSIHSAMSGPIECRSSKNPLSRKCESLVDCESVVAMSGPIECRSSNNPLSRKCQSIEDCFSIHSQMETSNANIIECRSSNNPDTQKCASTADCASIHSQMAAEPSNTNTVECRSSNNPDTQKCDSTADCASIPSQQVPDASSGIREHHGGAVPLQQSVTIKNAKRHLANDKDAVSTTASTTNNEFVGGAGGESTHTSYSSFVDRKEEDGDDATTSSLRNFSRSVMIGGGVRSLPPTSNKSMAEAYASYADESFIASLSRDSSDEDDDNESRYDEISELRKPLSVEPISESSFSSALSSERSQSNASMRKR